MRRDCTVLYCGGVDEVAFVIIPGDGVGSSYLPELRSVGGFAADSGDLGRPAIERVAELIRRGLLGCSAIIGRQYAKLHQAALEHGAVIIHECDRVRAQVLCVLRGVRRFAVDRLYPRIPTREGERVLRGGFLGGRLTGVSRHLAISDRSALEYSTVIIHEGNRVLVHRFGEGSRIGHIAGDSAYSRSPAGERVGVLRGRGLDGIALAGIDGRLAVIIGLLVQQASVVIVPGHRVGVGSRGVGRLVGCRAGYLGDRRIPTCKCVAVLVVAFLGRRLAAIHRYRAIFDHLFVEHSRSILIDEGDLVLVDSRSIRRGVSRIAGD